MKLCEKVLAVAAFATIAGCDSNPPAGPTVVTGITVMGETHFAELDQVHPLTATAQAENGDVRDVTAVANWRSSDTNVVVVSARGEASSVGFGVAMVTAMYQNVQGSRNANVALGPGGYRLGISAAPSCASLPSWAQHREYETSIRQEGSRMTLAVELDPGRTLSFPAAVNSMQVIFEFPPGHLDAYGDLSGPVFSQVVDDTSYFAVIGTASAALNGRTVSGRISGRITAADQRTEATCERADHLFTLAPR